MPQLHRVWTRNVAPGEGASIMIATLLTAVFGVFAASVLRGFTGFGFGLAAVPLLSLALPPSQVVPFVVVLQVIIGMGGMRQAWRQCDWRAVGSLAPGLILGIPIGLLVLTAFSANRVRLAIGGVILISVLILWRGFRLPRQPARAIGIAVGLISGVMSGLASMGGPPIVVYLLALSHTASIVRATSIVYFMLASMTSLTLMSFRGLIDREILLWSLASMPVLWAGDYAGTWGFRRSQPHHHRLVALVVLSVLGALLIARALARW